MSTYFDSSALVPIYVTEVYSKSARRAVRGVQVPWNALHTLEVFNTFERLVGVGSITRDQQRRLLLQFKEDAEQGRLRPDDVDLRQAVSDAHKLSLAHTAKFFTRSLDLLHLAVARLIGCTTFVSADRRQLSLAKVLGFRTIDIARPLQHRR